eukprot:11540252-Prorocentrum_lima.AAC.1
MLHMQHQQYWQQQGSKQEHMQQQHYAMPHQPMQPQPLFPASWAPRAHYVPVQVPMRHPQYGSSYGPMFAQQGGHTSPTMSMGYE